MLRNVVLGMRDVEHSVLSLTGKDKIGAELEAAGVSVTGLEGRAGLLLPQQLLTARRMARACSPDLIHSWMYHANVLAYWLRSTVGAAPPKLITSVRGALDAPQVQKRLLRGVRRIDAMLSARADAIIFNSRSSARQHVDAGYAPGRIQIIPNGFDVDRFCPDPRQRAAMRSEYRVADHQVVVGVLGRFNPLKGQRVFVAAAASIARRFDDCVFVLAGRDCDAANKELVGWLAEAGLLGKTRLLGERRDVNVVLNGLDIVVCPSLSESFPNAVGEAMACSKPCIVSDVGDCAYLVGDTGLAVPPHDESALERAIASLVHDADMRERLGQKARARIIGEFALGRVVEEYAEVYRKVVALRSPSRVA